MEELEFAVSERIFGNAPERIFVYLHNDKISVMNSPVAVNSFRERDVIFENGVDYILSLRIIDSVVSNYHKDGYFLMNGNAVVNLDNPRQSKMYNESMENHSTELDFSNRTLSSEQIVSFVREVTRDNVPVTEREDFRLFIRSNNVEDIVNESPYVLKVEINELIESGGNCSGSTDIYSVTAVQTLKGEFEVGYEFELIFFVDTVRSGEEHIVAVRRGSADPHPATGLRTYFFTSRRSLFGMQQQSQIEGILGMR